MHEATLHSLLQRITQGDNEALLQLHAEFIRPVYSVAYHILRNAMDAEEVTQDVFLKLWNKVEMYTPDKGHFLPWLLTMTRRTAIDKLRRIKPTLPLEDWESDAVTSADELQTTLASALDTLSVEQREAIDLAYFHGLSHTEIAAHLGRPIGTIKSHIRQGMQRLREIWVERVALDE